MIKRFSLICLFAMTLCVVATANIIPTNTSVTGSGTFTWNYDLQLSADQNVNALRSRVVRWPSRVGLYGSVRGLHA